MRGSDCEVWKPRRGGDHMKYRSKPIEVEAIEWEGTDKSWKALHAFTGEKVRIELFPLGANYLRVYTLNGEVQASPGDFIVKGVLGDFYPCKPEAFHARWEEIYDHDSGTTLKTPKELGLV